MYGERTFATGRGVALLTRWALSECGKSIEGARIAVQGFGNVGARAAVQLCDWGARLVGASDSEHALYDPHGLDARAVGVVDDQALLVLVDADALEQVRVDGDRTDVRPGNRYRVAQRRTLTGLIACDK